MAMLPDKVSFIRDTGRASILYSTFTYKYKDAASWDEEAGGPLHTGTLAKKLFGFCGFKIDFGKDAGLELDVSKKILCAYNKYEVKAGGDSEAVKAEIFEPSLMQFLFRVRQAGEDSDTWHVRTPQVCCNICGCPCACTGCPACCVKTVRYEFPISNPDKFEEDGKIAVEADFCCGGLCGTGGILSSRSRIFVDFPSGSRACTADCKHALMCIAMMLDAALLAPRSWCA
eukprot:CAMPEP_0116863914 /NCGR_PEP_ID=MMETSP0418-20121206/24512_1 /TAXON_ID=1158023 /ORGANISM="Astrosyne radiata, Strain 13vi08-1A" /LENGTH=228 /DNA_ID=CAMNT_0004499039 /DNA_START=9 /DNA_END=695 /DNA_ORIENTATION=-